MANETQKGALFLKPTETTTQSLDFYDYASLLLLPGFRPKS